MASKKDKYFKSTQEILENYFPKYSEKVCLPASDIEIDFSKTGINIAQNLAKEFQNRITIKKKATTK